MASASIFKPTLGGDRTQPETSEIGRLFHLGGAALPLSPLYDATFGLQKNAPITRGVSVFLAVNHWAYETPR
mgnify:CR=1 FL=1